MTTSFLADVNLWELVKDSGLIPQVIIGFLFIFSLSSWTIFFGKLGTFRRAKNANLRFVRAFRKATRLDAMHAAVEQFRGAPLVTVFDFGYSEVARQMAVAGENQQRERAGADAAVRHE